MSIERHGLTIGIERSPSEFFVTLKAVGKLTHQDYKAITPLIDSALDAVIDPKVKLFFDASQLEGWELRAAWDDFKLGLKHGNEFVKIAIYGNKNWLELSAQIGHWFMSGEIKYFDNEKQALMWLQV